MTKIEEIREKLRKLSIVSFNWGQALTTFEWQSENRKYEETAVNLQEQAEVLTDDIIHDISQVVCAPCWVSMTKKEPLDDDMNPEEIIWRNFDMGREHGE
tara:strand:+ start:363 stop:662 length:300 start_codon:yes stop_codon:yes gene_type:complete